MIHLFKSTFKIDWKYIVIELVLIVAGILLAINLDNWSAARKVRAETKVSIQKIREELSFNLEELREVNNINRDLVEFLGMLDGVVGESQTGRLRASTEKLRELMQDYSDYFQVTDSTKVSDNEFDYHVDVYYQIEYAELNDIAWQTAQISNAINAYKYDCLKEIISVYSFQELFTNIQNKFLDYGLLENFKQFVSTFQLYHKMSDELLQRYDSLNTDLSSCL